MPIEPLQLRRRRVHENLSPITSLERVESDDPFPQYAVQHGGPRIQPVASPAADPQRAEQAAATLRPARRLVPLPSATTTYRTPPGLRGETIGAPSYRTAAELDPEGFGYDQNPVTGRVAGYSTAGGMARRAALVPQSQSRSLAPVERGETIPEYLENPYVDLRPILRGRGVPEGALSGFGSVRRSQVKSALEPFPLPEPDRFSLSPGQTRFVNGRPTASLPAREPEMTEYQEASLDIQRERLRLQREAAELRRKSEAGELTPEDKRAMLQGLRGVVLRIRQNPVMGRQVSGMSDEELMAQEAEVTYGVSLEELRPSRTPEREPGTPGKLPGSTTPSPTQQPRTAEEYLELLR